MKTSMAMLGLSAALLAGTSLSAPAAETFNRVSTFNVIDNLPEGGDPAQSTAAEIITATEDGRTLVYSDSPGRRIGLIDIADPHAPKPAGTIALEGEPTSVVVAGGMALVGVVTSASKSSPSGLLATVALETRSVVATCDLGQRVLLGEPAGQLLLLLPVGDLEQGGEHHARVRQHDVACRHRPLIPCSRAPVLR